MNNIHGDQESQTQKGTNQSVSEWVGEWTERSIITHTSAPREDGESCRWKQEF